MPFFIKKKKGANPRAKYNQNKETKKNGTKRKLESRDDDEITSDEDDLGGVSSAEEGAQSEDEFETAQEKKVRLAKVYLEEIEKQERERLEDKTDENAVAKRLKVDYLKKVGKLRLSVADHFTGVDVNNIEVLKCKEHHIVTSVCASSDGYIYSGCKKGSIVKWSLSSKKKVGCIPFVKKSGTGKKILGHDSSILCMALSSDNKYLAIGDCGKDIQIWDPETLKHVGALIGHRESVTGLVFRRETHTLYSCSKDKAVKVWAVDVMSYVETLYGHQNGITSIDALSRERAITSGTDTSIRIWKIVEESQLLFNGHSKSIDIVRLINEENFISGGDDGQLCVWSVLKKKPACTVQEAHGFDTPNSEPFWITAVASLLNTDLIASGSYNGTIKLWKASENFRTLTEIHTVSLTGFVNDLKFTSDGKYLIAGVGPEHKFGRWTVIKSAKSSVVLIPLIGILC